MSASHKPPVYCTVCGRKVIVCEGNDGFVVQVKDITMANGVVASPRFAFCFNCAKKFILAMFGFEDEGGPSTCRKEER